MRKEVLKILTSIFTLAFGFIFFGKEEIVQANEQENSYDEVVNQVIDYDRTSKYTFEVTTIPVQENQNFSMYTENNKLNSTTMVLDYTEATFYDENYNEVDKDMVMETIEFDHTFSGVPGGQIIGGSWTSGSGYSIGQGLRAYFGTFLATLRVQFSFDIEIINGGPSSITNVYNENADVFMGSFGWMDRGVMKRSDTGGTPAYGGIRGQWTGGGGITGSTTMYGWLRLQGNSYWLDHNFDQH